MRLKVTDPWLPSRCVALGSHSWKVNKCSVRTDLSNLFILIALQFKNMWDIHLLYCSCSASQSQHTLARQYEQLFIFFHMCLFAIRPVDYIFKCKNCKAFLSINVCSGSYLGGMLFNTWYPCNNVCNIASAYCTLHRTLRGLPAPLQLVRTEEVS